MSNDSLKKDKYLLTDKDARVSAGKIGDREFSFQAEKWDGEVSLSISPRGLTSNKKLSKKSEKIECSEGEETHRVYKIGDLVEYGIEYTKNPEKDVVLDIDFPEGLEFLKQYELTEEEKKAGFERPENVIDSYAVYWKKKNNKYKTGKFCHIYRPKLIDARGVEVWCNQEIDAQAKTLTIDLDQDWLKKAAYPVILDPTFGYTTQGSSSYQRSTGYIMAVGLDANPDDDYTLDSVHVAIKDASGDKIRIGLYDDSSGINSLVVDCGEQTGGSDGWQTGTAGSESISNGAKYYAANHCNATRRWYYDSGGSQRIHPAVYSYGALPSSYPSGEWPGAVYHWSAYITVSAASVTQDLQPSGISSAEAFGTASVSPGAVSLSPSGISSGEAFGTAAASPGAVSLNPSGISSGEQFGTAVFALGAANINCTGITSDEAIGTYAISVGSVDVAPSGISSGEAFGTASISTGSVTLQPSGIASGEAFGTAAVSVGAVTLSPSGISSSEAFGTASVTPGAVEITPTGISSGETFGTAKLFLDVTPSGISSSETFGTASVTQGGGTQEIQPSGIASGEAFGTAKLSLELSPSGISSSETFGTATVSPGAITLQPSGISSGEAFGTASISVGAVSIIPTGITTGQGFGTATIGLVIKGQGIASEEDFGDHDISVGAVDLQPSGIASGENFGTAGIINAQILRPDGISSGEVFGAAWIIDHSSDPKLTFYPDERVYSFTPDERAFSFVVDGKIYSFTPDERVYSFDPEKRDFEF